MKYAFLLLLLLSLPFKSLEAFGRSGDLADPSFQDSGDTAIGISVSVSSTAATLVYDPTNTGFIDREVLLQNTSTTYDVHCGTHSAVTASSGPRWVLWTSPSGNLTTNGRYGIYCLGEAGSGSIEILGSVEYDSVH